MDSVIEEIKQRIDIVELISSYLKLEKTGANYRAVCPFHSEKKPSFFVNPARQIWRCFGCGKGGDAFGFVMEIEGIEFGDALKILAQKAGVELKKQDPRLSTQRKRLYDICELTTKFFEKHLYETKTGKEIIQYLLGRGLSKDSIKEWRIGYSPDSWQGLSDFLQKSGFTIQEIEKAGLLVRNEVGKLYDRFRGRIMFPIFDLNSQPVGFGGRVFGEQESVAKYINIVNTPIYDKSRILYGLDKAKVEIRKNDSFVLVEGYTDAIMAHQAGAKNVVAVSGTALTPFHLNILKRYSSNLFSCFDMDVAGDSATKRGIDLAQKEGFNIKIITLPEGKDPAEAIAKDINIWNNSLENAKSILDFYFESAFKKYDKTKPEAKKAISQILLPVIKRIPNKIETAHWVDLLSKELNVPKRAVEEELDKYKGEKAVETEEEHSCEPKIQTRQEKLQERIVCLILQWPVLIKELNKETKEFFSEEFLKILEKLEEIKPKEWEKIAFEDSLNNIFNDIFLQAKTDEDLINQTEKEAREEFLSSINDFLNLSIKTKLFGISEQVKKLELENDTEKEIAKLMEEYKKIAKKLIDNQII
ncbi:MAG: DNA primase [Candidatus Pacebacteria bacterium]|nr:DNA primase [Candidatus Paceibacterota bacterium]